MHSLYIFTSAVLQQQLIIWMSSPANGTCQKHIQQNLQFAEGGYYPTEMYVLPEKQQKVGLVEANTPL